MFRRTIALCLFVALSLVLTPSHSFALSAQAKKEQDEFVYWNSKSYTELEKLAQSGNAEAQFQLGKKVGPFVINLITEDWMDKAAEQGHFFAKCSELLSWEKESKWWNDAPTLRSALEKRKDSPLAKYFLAYFYREGIGGPQNDEWAEYYILQAAEQGNVQAQYEIRSIEHLQRAANLGFADAQTALAQQIKDENPELAIKWYRDAASQGNTQAQDTLIGRYKSGEASQEDVLTPLNTAVSRGYPEAFNTLGEIYLKGNIAPQDYRKGYSLIEQAANRGVIKGKYNLACILYKGLAGEGFAVNRDYAKAMQGYQKISDYSTGDIVSFCRKYGEGDTCEDTHDDMETPWQKAFDSHFKDMIEFRASSVKPTPWQRVVKNTGVSLRDGFLLPYGKPLATLRHESEGSTLGDIIQKVATAWKPLKNTVETEEYTVTVEDYWATPWETRAFKEGSSTEECIGMMYTLLSLGVQPEQIRVFWDSFKMGKGSSYLAVSSSENLFWLGCGKARGRTLPPKLRRGIGLKKQKTYEDEYEYVPVYYYYLDYVLTSK